jgi:hypothetical protein
VVRITQLLSGGQLKNEGEIMSEIMRHPEQKENELYLGNWFIDDVIGARPKDVGWTQIRIGFEAYDVFGNIVPKMVPVFVNEKEVPETIRNTHEHFKKQRQDET